MSPPSASSCPRQKPRRAELRRIFSQRHEPSRLDPTRPDSTRRLIWALLQRYHRPDECCERPRLPHALVLTASRVEPSRAAISPPFVMTRPGPAPLSRAEPSRTDSTRLFCLGPAPTVLRAQEALLASPLNAVFLHHRPGRTEPSRSFVLLGISRGEARRAKPSQAKPSQADQS